MNELTSAIDKFKSISVAHDLTPRQREEVKKVYTKMLKTNRYNKLDELSCTEDLLKVVPLPAAKQIIFKNRIQNLPVLRVTSYFLSILVETAYSMQTAVL